jgi:hypothetical protein
MGLRVHSGIPHRAFREQERSKMAKDFARLGYLVTDRPLSDDLIADLIHALEDDEAGVGVGKRPEPPGSAGE